MHQASNAAVALHLIIAGAIATLGCHRMPPPLPSGAMPGDSVPHCADSVTIELASGQKIAKSRLCFTEHGDTSYGVAYAPDLRVIWRATAWRMDNALVDSAVDVLTQRLDRERGKGKPCKRQGIERYWGSPPNILILTLERPDMNHLPASVSLAEETVRPKC